VFLELLLWFEMAALVLGALWLLGAAALLLRTWVRIGSRLRRLRWRAHA
jgi:hypothetical protein